MPAVPTRCTYPLCKQGGKTKKHQVPCHERFPISAVYRLGGTKSPGKSVHRSLKRVNKSKGELWSGQSKWQIWNEDYKTLWILGSGQESFVGATDAILSCTGCCHLCITVQPNLCCWQLCSLPCNCPRNCFPFFFWCHHVANSWTLVLHQQHKTKTLPVVEPAVAGNSILLLLLLVGGPLKLPSLRAPIKPAEGLVSSLSPEFGGIATRVAGFT